MDILVNDPAQGSSKYSDLRAFLGFFQLANVLEIAGILSASIIIVVSVLTLFIANYMKTRAQTKERIIMGLTSIAYIAAFPFLADVILTIIKEAFF
jgi:hypothetical protein